MNQFKFQGHNDCDPRMELKGIDRLPHELIIEILSRLPVKALCRCRCVSKSWLLLLTRDEDFMSRHMEWCKRSPQLLVRRYLSDGLGEHENSKTTVELTSIDMQGDVMDKFQELLDGPVHTFVSCGPLSILCCAQSLYVCNPSIRQVVRVPSSCSRLRLHNVGFGYLPVSNEYKIVHLGNGKTGCEIFTFGFFAGVKSGSWRTIGDCPISAWTDEYPLCVNGSIYWACSSGFRDKSILSLDLKTEEFSTISHPLHESERYRFFQCIGLMGGLSVVGFCTQASTIDIWVMNDKRDKKWTMGYSINLGSWPKFLIPLDYQSNAIIIHMEEKDVICYSFESRSYQKIEYYKNMKHYNKPSLYYGSLASVLGS